MSRIVFAAICLGLLSACAVLHDAGDETPETTPPATSPYTPISFDGEKATAQERATCEAAGGEVRQAGLLGWDNCIQPMPDAGQACSNQSDCIDRCMLPIGKEYAEFGEEVTGQCSANDNPFGCYQTVDNGMATPALCVD